MFLNQTGKFVTLSMPWCGGLCNFLYRFASLYGIARSVNRVPYIEGRMDCVRKSMAGYAAAMPNLHSHIIFKNVKQPTKVNFASDWCKYDDPKKLKEYSNATNLRISGGFLQSFKFFHPFKPDIRRLFEFGPGVRSLVADYAVALFGDDSSHKLCVHTRVGDFKKHFLLESRLNFTNSAIKFVHKQLRKTVPKMSIVFIGADKDFNTKVRVPKKIFQQRYIIDGLSAFEDLHLGSTYCDSLLLTASGSTFGFWIGYLMSEDKQNRIFYNIETAKNKGFCKNSNDYDTFLPQWKRVRELKNGSLILEKRWHVDIERAEKKRIKTFD
ncbi:hypothetical protein M3Y98_00869000 [Aphelenchoides besseyi]|nr:hypothetical protein M3Y98_00869000 [Aphelenchoides besseyi]